MKHCKNCNEKLILDDEYDSYYCPVCNEWTEKKCDDKNCEYCKDRPDKHIEDKL